MEAVDCSNYGGELAVEIVRRWYANGKRKVIVGVGRDWELARRQIQAALAGGMVVEVYVYLYFGVEPAGYLDRVSLAIRGLPVSFKWLDFEDTDAPQVGYSTELLVCAWIQHCLDVAAARWDRSTIGIYTARWWWNPWTSGADQFRDWPLWVAEYDGDASLSFTPFGGWVPPATMKQYQGTVELCDFSVDLDYYREVSEVDKEARAKAEAAKAVADAAAYRLRIAGLIQMGDGETAYHEMQALRKFCGLPLVVV